MNDGTMEYSIKTGASLDDLQTLKQNLFKTTSYN